MLTISSVFVFIPWSCPLNEMAYIQDESSQFNLPSLKKEKNTQKHTQPFAKQYTDFRLCLSISAPVVPLFNLSHLFTTIPLDLTNHPTVSPS